MLKQLALAAALVAAALPTLAEEAPILAEYWTDSGSLPPEYAWETKVSIHADGQLDLKYCKGYETEGPGCKTRKAQVRPEQIEAIHAAIAASELGTRPAKDSEEVMVGGGLTGGQVFVDGVAIKLPSQPANADANRVGDVLRAIRAAVPARFERFFGD